jgi:hypothetical protein
MPLSVIGAGFGRTGTLSTKLALEQLGFGPCYHMIEVFQNPEGPAIWEKAADGEPVDWENIFANYNATVDWPSCSFYRELAEAYPQAKVILTVRDPEAWFASTQATIFAHDMPDPATSVFESVFNKVIARLFDGRMHDRDKLLSVFAAHNAQVQAVIAPGRLLVYDVAEGWGPLCEFLEVPVPDGPMPKVNSTKEFQEHFAQMADTAFGQQT